MVLFLIDPMDDFLADNRRSHLTFMIPGYRFRQCKRVNEGLMYCPKRSYVLAMERLLCLLALLEQYQRLTHGMETLSNAKLEIATKLICNAQFSPLQHGYEIHT